MHHSMYGPAWNQLKSDPSKPLVIAAHPAHHRRIYKAIIKQKYEDSVFQYLMSEAGKKATLSSTSVAGTLTIRMTVVNYVPVERMFI